MYNLNAINVSLNDALQKDLRWLLNQISAMNLCMEQLDKRKRTAV